MTMTNLEFDELILRAHEWWEKQTSHAREVCAPWLLAAMFTREEEMRRTQAAKAAPPAAALSALVAAMLGLPREAALLAAIQEAITAEAQYLRMAEAQAAKTIVLGVERDRALGLKINRFYFTDTRWREGGKNAPREDRKSFAYAREQRDKAHAILDAKEVDRGSGS